MEALKRNRLSAYSVCSAIRMSNAFAPTVGPGTGILPYRQRAVTKDAKDLMYIPAELFSAQSRSEGTGVGATTISARSSRVSQHIMAELERRALEARQFSPKPSTTRSLPHSMSLRRSIHTRQTSQPTITSSLWRSCRSVA